MQYTNEQLRIIINFLPEDVKQYLSFNNSKYKELMAMPNFSVQQSVENKPSNLTKY